MSRVRPRGRSRTPARYASDPEVRQRIPGAPGHRWPPVRLVGLSLVVLLSLPAATSAPASASRPRPSRAAEVVGVDVEAWARLSGVDETIRVPDIADGDCAWLAPVDAPIVDPFRAPSNPFGAGNRGIEYGTSGGEAVVAVAAGRVTFSGPVAGRRYVVVSHPSGLRSTYGPLQAASVVRGQAVDAGHGLGPAAAGLHLTARLDDRYVDPAPLLAGVCGRVRLVSLFGNAPP